MFWRRGRRDASADESRQEQPAAVETTPEPAVPGDAEPVGPVAAEPAGTPEAQAAESTAPESTAPESAGSIAPEPGPPEAPPIVPGGTAGQAEPSATIADGLQASRRGFMARLHGIFRGGAADEAAWEEAEETLIAGDVGARLAMDVVARARGRRDPAGPEAAVRAELERLLPAVPAGPWRPSRPDPSLPAVILVVGVNGTGKTTSIAKIAARLAAEGDRVILAAADTFRAAAIEQLAAWASRLDLPVVAHKAGADPSAVVFDALDAAVARGADVVIVDTAGRLHTRHNLMEELGKIRRTIDKRLPGVVPEVLFVLDATTGQNGLVQAKAFHEATGLTGIVLTKLDSTAKGGIVFAIEQALGVPVVFAGVGERVGDLVDFQPASFVEALFA